MDSWERFDEGLLPDKKDFYGSLNMEDITDVDYKHAKKVFKNIDNKTGIELELLIDVDMLLMVEKGISGGIWHAIHRYVKANNKYMKNYDKNKESSYIQYLDANSLYGWAMSQNLPVEGFKWKKKC